MSSMIHALAKGGASRPRERGLGERLLPVSQKTGISLIFSFRNTVQLYCPASYRFGSGGLLALIFLSVPRAGLCKVNKPSGFCFRTNRLRSTTSSRAPPDRQKISATPFRTSARAALHGKYICCFAVLRKLRDGGEARRFFVGRV